MYLQPIKFTPLYPNYGLMYKTNRLHILLYRYITLIFMAFYIYSVKYRFHNIENQTTYAQIIYYYSALFCDIFMHFSF